MKANPLVSEGARLERDAIRSYLKRSIHALESMGLNVHEYSDFQIVLNWVNARRVRYNSKKGGLGK